MKTYEVTLISEDGQKFFIEVGAQSDQDAVDYALNKIQQKGWQVYNYKLHQLKRIT